MTMRVLSSVCLAACGVALSRLAHAGAPEPIDEQEAERLKTWLASSPASEDVTKTEDLPEAPPPPPRRHGFVLESSLGALTHLGAMKHVSPTSPWFRLAFGWEPTKWLMLLAQGDVTVASTTYANPPPEPRGYTLFGVSAGLRYTQALSEIFAAFLQGEIGVAQTSNDVLLTYGFQDANALGPYFGGVLGLEWDAPSPHLAVVAQAGLRSYDQILHRSIAGDNALAWIGAVGIKHTF